MVATKSALDPATPATLRSATLATFDERLFDYRCELAGATNDKEKAALLGVAPSTVSRWRKGQRPGVDLARVVALRLGVSVDQLWPVTS